MSVISNNQLAGASGQGGSSSYEISRSLRFNSGDSSYLSKTPSSAGNRKTWTWSCWVKKHKNGANQQIFGQYKNTTPYADTRFQFYFNTSDQIQIHTYSLDHLKTTRVFRDNSAWYHIVLAVDTTLSTADNRMRLYVNGVEETTFASRNNPSQNQDLGINTDGEFNIGTAPNAKSSYYIDCSLAEIHFIDGQALAATDFGEYDSNNVWQPKEFSGSHGTNGFNLDFSDTSDVGNDAAGSNNWTPNNLFGVAPGLSTANQGMDVVTYSGTGSTNAISLNFQPDFVWIKRRNGANAHALFDSVRGVTKVLESSNTGAEKTNDPAITSFDTNGFTVGGTYGQTNASGGTYAAWCWKAGGTASSNTDGSITSSVSVNTTYGFSIVAFDTGASSSNETVGHGLGATPKLVIVKDRDAVDHWYTWSDTFSNSTGHYLRLDGNHAVATSTGVWGAGMTSSVIGLDANQIGGDNIAYCWSEVSGFSKFDTYSGDGNSGKKITTGFKPRFVAIKRTDTIENWHIFDSERGGTKSLFPDLTNAEVDNSSRSVVFVDDGFTLGTQGGINASGGTYIYAAFAGEPDDSVVDCLIDTPMNLEADSGNNPGNYATLNPLDNGGQTLSNGNLDLTGVSSVWRGTRANFGMSSGKHYWEVDIKFNDTASSQSLLGIATADAVLTNNYASIGAYAWEYYSNNGNKFHNGNNPSFGASYGSGDVVGFAFDADAGSFTIYKNGVSQGTAYTGLTSGPYFPSFSLYGTASVSFNAGQRPFAYTPPTGYKSLCTTNLPDPTIADGSTVFDVRSGLTAQFTISDLNFAADLVVAKSTSNAEYWIVADVVRSFIGGLRWNDTNAEGSGDAISSVGATGYQSNSNWFTAGRTYATFNWDAGSSTVSNTDGSITSSVRANPSAGFSIVEYTVGSNTAQTIGHGLNAAPEFIIVKETNQAGNWQVQHSSLGATKVMSLNQTGAAGTNNLWNDTSPTSSVFSIRSGGSANFYDGKEHIAYCFAPVAGYSAFGSYTGNGNADGPFVYTGFRPRWIMHKRTDTGGANVGDWRIWDTARDTDNAAESILFPSGNNQEATHSAHGVDILSNGFKLRTSDSNINPSGGTFIYAAFAEHPFKTSRAR